MTTVVLSAFNVANYPAGGGHFWVYMQYVQGLRQLGCDVYWLEDVRGSGKAAVEASQVAEFRRRMERYGMGDKLFLYESRPTEGGTMPRHYLGRSRTRAEAVFRRADLLLNFHYTIDPDLLALFARTALVDIDPGLLQTWLSTGQLLAPRHDVYFTTGETVGKPGTRIPDCGMDWRHIRPPVSLPQWPAVSHGDGGAFTTVSSWWTYDWLEDAEGRFYDNNKRVTFLQFLDLPRFTSQALELALNFGDSPQDADDRRLLEHRGWRVRHSLEVAGSPEAYQDYIQQSRGEFSCAKPSCMKFQGAWISDRTLCYLASGKPVVVQDTGPSAFLPEGRGMFRFSTREGAAGALEAIDRQYGRHCRAAREIAEQYFDAADVAESILNQALSQDSRRSLRAAIPASEAAS